MPADPSPLRIGSLFSGYGGLDLAVEHVFNAQTVWFSEINPVQRVFAHHWPDAPNLGDITAIDWGQVPAVDILCGGFPCQDVSTVGKMAGLAPGTRSGLWSHMAEAIDHLRPEFVVIENVRGLLSATAIRATPDAATPEGASDATPAPTTVRNLEPDAWGLADDAARPLRALGAVLGDLADLRYDAQWIGLPAASIGAPHPRFRVFILAHRTDTVPHPARLRRGTRRGKPRSSASEAGHDRALTSGYRPGLERAGWLGALEERIGDTVVADRGHRHRWGRYADAIARWEHITGRPAPAPTLIHESGGTRPAPAFLEWLMGLESRWITNPLIGLTANQELAALGNGVLPLQAAMALRMLEPDQERVVR
ncbi:DNA cytosine methyltransferase [Leucobacter sp. HNU]|uniref:DNA cytosine methyltransferase n=1 Tax=Leucobacter sp. HNU TaxID=3236805 RepID=UPI003A800061